ncbi:uncharacterized protein [Choristoneura fumiferana]|uniref:uncharacterized protein n=1 Tax=Choristoneura fumiferana TaxID=7141 RepID=UPI003D15B282
MYSDNATCFKLVSEVIQKPYCIENNIFWKFIPKLAPWHGGYYERLMALVKHCLKRTLEKHSLNDSNLLTILKEIEAVLNTRPLTKVGSEIDHVLRPVDFLNLGKCLSMKPSAVEVAIEGTVTKADLITSWKRGLRILEEFKKMFSNQYLASLRERYKHTPKQPRVKSNRTPKVGDLVQIKSDLKNRQLWKVGRIDSLSEGHDGECRAARVNVGDSILTRSIGHLYPLEVDGTSPEMAIETEAEETESLASSHPVDVEEQEQSVADQVNEPRTQTAEELSTSEDVTVTSADELPLLKDLPVEAEERSKRAAAVRARDKILEWTRHLLTLLN